MKISIIKMLIVFLLLTVSENIIAQVEISSPNTKGLLYLGEGVNQPLIVGLGGAEGGNAWSFKRWKNVRDQFIEKGYAFLALAYFGGEGLPDTLDRISIEDVHNAVLEASKNPKINNRKIIILGGSIGAELGLVIASYYKDIKCVICFLPSHVVFPGHKMSFSTSCWTYKGKELPFIPVNEEALQYVKKDDYRSAFEAALKNTVAEEKALIKVEKIKGPILLLSATKDEVWPSTPMAEKIVNRLKSKNYKYYYEHIKID